MGEILAEGMGGSEISDDWLLAGARIGTVFAAGAVGKDINDADSAASNAVENNYLNHREELELNKSAAACSGELPDLNACGRANELRKLSRERDEEFERACEECNGGDDCTKLHYLHVTQWEEWNKEAEERWISDPEFRKEFRFMSESGSIYHNFNPENPGDLTTNGNKKYVHENGQFEIVTDGKGNIVFDPTNRGTYNYYPPNIIETMPIIGNHYAYDIDPYDFYGNGQGDKTSRKDREDRIYCLLPLNDC